jgi:(p)ppGpp synthase/HD superfamily hydrolase
MPDPVNRPLYSDRLLDALQVAARLHATQARKGTQIPYLSHLLGTCSIAMEFGADEDQAIAALLHDAIEDVEPVELARDEVGRFGPEVLRIVEACTDSDAHPKPPWHDRKEAYLAHLPEADAAILLVSASDKLHNARTIVTDLHRVGDAVWGRFRTASRDDSLWYYHALVEAFRANPEHQPDLIAELDRTVTEIERLA